MKQFISKVQEIQLVVYLKLLSYSFLLSVVIKSSFLTLKRNSTNYPQVIVDLNIFENIWKISGKPNPLTPGVR